MMLLTLIAACSVFGVHPKTTEALIQIESGGNALALGLNADRPGLRHPTSIREATKLASELIAKGESVDLGLMQVNSKNLQRLGLTVEDAFDRCKNIHAGSQILKEGYDRAEAALGPGQDALKATVSAYNTGNFKSGLENGYVAKFYGHNTKPAKPNSADIAVTFDYDVDDNGFGSSKSDFERRGTRSDLREKTR